MVEVANRIVDFLTNYFDPGSFQEKQSKKPSENEVEESVLDYIKKNVEPGNAQEVLNKIDEFGWKKSFLMNIGDVKGEILDEKLDAAKPKVVLELGTYVGYSGIRMANMLESDGHLYSIEKCEAYANIARQMIEHAGLSHKITVIVGTLKSSLTELKRLGVETIDFTLIDHYKHEYLPDMELMLNSKLFKKGSVVFADNIIFPGAPDYLSYIENSKLFLTEKISTELEYNHSVKDMVTVSIFLGEYEENEQQTSS